MSILFSQNLSSHNEIAPQEANFTEVLCSIAVVPKKLYFYGKMPENGSKSVVKNTTSGRKISEAERLKNDDLEVVKRLDFDDKNNPETGSEGIKSSKLCQNGIKTSKNGLGMEKLPVLAIVGTRKPTKYGEKIAYELAYEAAKRGAVVVSGLAYGIDSIAHRGALDAGGVTVAVLGTPIDQIYPRAHLGLAEKIVETGGCIMSEIAPGEEFWPKTSFLQRNRLISGLADVVVIPEAAERSGSLNTAAHALEQGKEIFAVPGDILRPQSKGCNRLIRQGAMPYLEASDVLDLLFPPEKKPKRQQVSLIGDTDAETAILAALMAGVDDGEEILERTGLGAAEFGRSVTMLEIKGRVRGLGMNRWGLR